MQLYHGTYAFPIGAASISTNVLPEWGAVGQILRTIHTWDIETTLQVSTTEQSVADAQTEMAARIAEFKAAITLPYRDLVLYQDNGQPSAMVLRNSGSLTGVRLTRYSEPTTEGAENDLYRTIRVSFEASYPFLGGVANPIVSYQETLEFSGGLPLYEVYPSINGNNQEQLIYPREPYACVQSGTAVGYLDYPPFPLPLFQHGRIRRAKTGGEQQGLIVTNWGIRWNYEFKSVTPLNGVPHVWRGY